jgi:hypothetical protein
MCEVMSQTVAAHSTKLANGVLLISVDDDVILESHAIEELVAAHMRHPECILGFMGHAQSRFVHAEHVAESVNVDSIGGYRGVLYPSSVCMSMLPMLLLLHMEHMTTLKRGVIDDDHSLQQCAIYCNIQRKVIRTNFPCTHETPATRIVPKLNILFLSNADGVSGKIGTEDLVQASRDTTDAFFKKMEQFRIKK